MFQAFARIIRAADDKFLVLDTAPTGHTVLLLDATGAYHREVIRQMDRTATRSITPMMQLQDPKRTQVLIVTRAETTPVLAATRLQADLRRAGIEPWAWIINGSLAAAAPEAPLLRQRAAGERREINRIAHRHAARYAVLPWLRDEPLGTQSLRALMGPAPMRSSALTA